jgi:hypothetical protein
VYVTGRCTCKGAHAGGASAASGEEGCNSERRQGAPTDAVAGGVHDCVHDRRRRGGGGVVLRLGEQAAGDAARAGVVALQDAGERGGVLHSGERQGHLRGRPCRPEVRGHEPVGERPAHLGRVRGLRRRRGGERPQVQQVRLPSVAAFLAGDRGRRRVLRFLLPLPFSQLRLRAVDSEAWEAGFKYIHRPRLLPPGSHIFGVTSEGNPVSSFLRPIAESFCSSR